MTRAALLSLSTLLTLCLAGSPSEATLTFTQSGPGLTPCAQGLCLELHWEWSGNTMEPTGETSVDLPTPDPAQWVLSSGSMSSGGSASVTG